MSMDQTKGVEMGDRVQRAKGKAEEMKGRAKRETGEATAGESKTSGERSTFFKFVKRDTSS